MPTSMAPWASGLISSIANIVSIHATSAPPAFNPSISSRNTSMASRSVSAPSGSNNAPPVQRPGNDDRTITGVGDFAGQFCSRGLAISKTRSSALWSASRSRLQPKVLVRMMSAPGVDEILVQAASPVRGVRSSRTRAVHRFPGPSRRSLFPWRRRPTAPGGVEQFGE